MPKNKDPSLTMVIIEPKKDPEFCTNPHVPVRRYYIGTHHWNRVYTDLGNLHYLGGKGGLGGGKVNANRALQLGNMPKRMSKWMLCKVAPEYTQVSGIL